MAQLKPISFTAPTDYTTEQQSLLRQRALAEALTKESSEPMGQGQMVSGWYVPESPLKGVAKLLKAYSGKKMAEESDAKEKALATRYQQELADTLRRAGLAQTGQPAIPEGTDPEGMRQYAVDEVKPDPLLAAQIMMGHPATQQLGMESWKQGVTQQQIMDVLNKGWPQGAGATPGAQNPGAAPTQGGMPAGIPGSSGVPQGGGIQAFDPRLAALRMVPGGEGIAGDISKREIEGKKLALDQQKVAQTERHWEGLSANQRAELALKGISNAREWAEAIHRGVALPSMPNPGQQPITQQGAVPMPIAPQQTPLGQPLNIPQQSPINPQPAAQQPVSAPRVGGMSPAGAQDVAKRQGELEAEKAVKGSVGQQEADKKFAEEYTAFVPGGGYADAQKNMVQLEGALNALQKESNITGFWVGLMPDSVLKRTNPRAFAVKQQVEEVVQRNLRTILGAQFTQQEGFALISRAYDASLSPEENAARMNRLITQMQAGLQIKLDAAKYFEQNGTLRGWKGQLMTKGDFYRAMEGNGQSSSGKVRPANPASQASPGTKSWKDL